MQGSAEIMPGNVQERAVSAVHYMISIIVLALFISKLTTVLQAMAEAKNKEQELIRLAYTFMKSNKIGVELRIRLQRFLNDKASVGKKTKEISLQNELLSTLPPALRQALIMEVRGPAVIHGLIMSSLLRYHSTFAEQVVCNLMLNDLHSPGDKVFQHGIMCNRVYFLDAGVGWYLPCSPLIPHVKAAVIQQSTEMWKDWYAAYWHRLAFKVEELGTRWCEAALFVGWIHTGDLEADPNKALSLLVLEAHEFEDLVAKFTEVQTALLVHATRICVYLALNTQVTDLFKSETAMEFA